MSDPIKPNHYNALDDSGIKCYQAITAQMGEDRMVGFYWGNAVKYLWRWPRKNKLEDLKKAVENLRMLIDMLENKKEVS